MIDEKRVIRGYIGVFSGYGDLSYFKWFFFPKYCCHFIFYTSNANVKNGPNYASVKSGCFEE